MYTFPDELRAAYENSPLSYVYYQNIDGKAVPILASAGFCERTGMDRDHVLEWLETGLFERMHPDDVGLMSGISVDFMDQKGPYDAVFRCRLGDRYISIHGFGKWQTMPDGTELAVISYVNVTDTLEGMVREYEKYGRFQADRFYNDSLTGLPNLNYLHEFGDERARVIRLEGNTPVVAFFDVYSMQSYNNQYGVKEGDNLLRLIADTLKEQFPTALIVRGANDHFIMVTDLEEKGALTDGIEKANELIKRNARGNTSGIRCGICSAGDELSVTDALDHARHALRRINNDMNHIWRIFSQAADDRYWRERYIIENFERALEKGWFKVFYQGIVRPSTGKIAAFEALARWVDPSRGIISPADFIPVLQRYHMLHKLDLYMFEQVCKEVYTRRDNGLPLLPVSVNFSRQDFDNVDVVAEMNAIYERHGLSDVIGKDYCIVEITEQDIAEGSERFLNQLNRLHESGFPIWLDDFGSGYSAINMFHQYRFDLIKYDMELLRHLDDNGGVNRVILKDMIGISRKLGTHTLIEGLETEEQLEFVLESGCELAQGYYYVKPESLDEILFRIIEGGQLIKPCETREERILHEREWFK